MAKLYFRYGAMGCGKTAILLQVAFNYKEKGGTAIVMKPVIDTKAGSKLQTRIGLEREVDYLVKEKDDLFEIINDKFGDSDCILVDEAQFLNRKQVDELMKVTCELEIPVICYGLRTDFMVNGFEGSTRLLEIAHTIEELKTICSCGKKAMYNIRYKNDKLVTAGEQIVIDDSKEIRYAAMCPKCYYEEVKNSKIK